MAKKNRRSRRKYLVLVLILIIAFFVCFKTVLRAMYPLKYKDSLISYSREYGVDPDLVAAVIKTESNYNDEAESQKGAMGLMQIMPDTGTWISETIGMSDFSIEMLRAPDTNIRFGVWYLNELSKQFNGEYDCVIAAYNGGPGNVNKWLQNQEYSSNGINLDTIPFKETRNYVKSVTFNHKMYKYLYNLNEE